MTSRPANNVLIGRRGALGDLGNTLHTLHNDTTTNLKRNVMGPSKAAPQKNDDATKKIVPTLSKENKLKTNNEKVCVKVPCRKPIREASIVLPKKTEKTVLSTKTEKPVVTKKTEKPVVTTKTEKTVVSTKTTVTDLVKPTVTIYDPDEKSEFDPQLVTEYVNDIMAHLRSLEDQFPIEENFLENSKVTPKMRSIVVNWLVEVHKNFSMSLETLYLTISILDRYLQLNKAVDRNILQLVGTSALLLAGKYEEVYIPDLNDFVYICDDAFTKEQILQMEVDISKKLDFRMGWPIATYFLRRYSKIAKVKIEHHNLAKYILETALLEYHLVHIKPSIQAAAATCLAMAIINEVMNPEKVWTPTLVKYSKYIYSDFKLVVIQFAHMIVKAETSRFDNVRKKYSTSQFGKISLNFKLQGMLIRKLTLK